MSVVVVVGSANVDLVVDVPRHPAGGETILGGALRRTPGGKGANQAVAAAKAGAADTTFVGAVGADDAGALLRASLDAAGVRTDLLATVHAETGIALITVSPDGENAIVVAPGANDLVSIDAAASARIAVAGVLLAQLETPFDALRRAAAARGSATRFVLNAAPSRTLPDDVWRALDVLVVNEHEAVDLADSLGLDGAGDDPVEIAGALLARVPAVVVTLGGAGVAVVERSDTWSPGGDRVDASGAAHGGATVTRIAAMPVQVVDTTGAGDTFCGVLAAALASGASLPEAARRGAAAGALAVTRAGAQDAVPTAAEVDDLLAAGGFS